MPDARCPVPGRSSGGENFSPGAGSCGLCWMVSVCPSPRPTLVECSGVSPTGPFCLMWLWEALAGHRKMGELAWGLCSSSRGHSSLSRSGQGEVTASPRLPRTLRWTLRLPRLCTLSELTPPCTLVSEPLTVPSGPLWLCLIQQLTKLPSRYETSLKALGLLQALCPVVVWAHPCLLCHPSKLLIRQIMEEEVGGIWIKEVIRHLAYGLRTQIFWNMARREPSVPL